MKPGVNNLSERSRANVYHLVLETARRLTA